MNPVYKDRMYAGQCPLYEEYLLQGFRKVALPLSSGKSNTVKHPVQSI